MRLSRLLLKVFHPAAEEERSQLRALIAQADAQACDVSKTMKLETDQFREWLKSENCACCEKK